MNKTIKMAALAVAMTMLVAACGTGDKFKKTESGVLYRFESSHPEAQQVQSGDVLVGEMQVRFDTTQMFDNIGHTDRILMADPNFFLYEGLLMMHVGDKAVFAYSADSLAHFMQGGQMPPFYQAGKGMMVYYEVSLQDIVTREELAQEQANYLKEVEERRQNEPEMIANYVRENNITAKPNAKGLYVVVKKKGNGQKVATGRTVAINYTGRLLDGTMFDSSVESDAIRGGINEPGATYEPITYTVGQMGLIEGWETGIDGMPEGSVLQLIMPSSLGYGSRGAGSKIPPYSPLVFDMEIVSVR